MLKIPSGLKATKISDLLDIPSIKKEKLELILNFNGERHASLLVFIIFNKLQSEANMLFLSGYKIPFTLTNEQTSHQKPSAH